MFNYFIYFIKKMNFLYIGAILTIISEFYDIYYSYKQDRWAYILYNSQNIFEFLAYYEVVEILCHTLDHIIWLSSGSIIANYHSQVPIFFWIIYLYKKFNQETYFCQAKYIFIISFLSAVELLIYLFNKRKNNNIFSYYNYFGIIPNIMLFSYDLIKFYLERKHFEIDGIKIFFKVIKSLFWIVEGIHLQLILLIINNILGILSSVFGIIRKFYLKKVNSEEKINKLVSYIKERLKIENEKCMKIVCLPEEGEFKFEEESEIIFKTPREIYNSNWILLVNINDKDDLKNKINKLIKISYIPKPQEKEIFDYFIKQTNIANCFLVSSIISLINIPGILDYLFFFEDRFKHNYTDSDEYINLYCYLRGVKKIIKIKNTFPSFKYKDDENNYMNAYNLSPNLSPIPFTTTKNGILLGQILIKAFICLNYLSYDKISEAINKNSSRNNNDIEIYLTNKDKDLLNGEIIIKDEKYTMENIYKDLNKGGNLEHPMDIFLGCISEIFLKELIKNENDKKRILKKIIKYLDIGGFIEVCNSDHAYSLEGYIKIEENNKITYYFSIINPHRGKNNFKDDHLNEKCINEMKSPYCEKSYNKEEIEKIKFINEIYPKTGHMMMKDDILFKWFFYISLQESMFGAKEILFKIEEKEAIDFKIISTSKICIDICSTDKNIPPILINKYIEFNLTKMKKGDYEKIDLIDEINEFKIYEKLEWGNYRLSFKILPEGEKIQFKCRIKYFESKCKIISILKKEEEREYFSEIRKLTILKDEVINYFENPEIKEYLPENPKYNRIEIDYDNNTKLYWVKGNNGYKVYSLNYKNYIIMIIYDLLYFVPCFTITYNKNGDNYKIEAPKNDYLIVNEDFEILKISKRLKPYAKIGDKLEDYHNNIKKIIESNDSHIFKKILKFIFSLPNIIISMVYKLFLLLFEKIAEECSKRKSKNYNKLYYTEEGSSLYS